MISTQMTFKRYEIKYLLTSEQKSAFMNGMREYMMPDSFGRSVIRNIYYDTPDCRLARRSIEKPMYKEKLRVRSYTRPGYDDNVFIELKKKYDSVVYKRRMGLPLRYTTAWLSDKITCPDRSQVAREIDYFKSVYINLEPKAYISYEREAFYAKDDHEFRVTFDENILGRIHDLTLMSDPSGRSLLENGMTLMEIKVGAAMPIWCASLLSGLKIYPYSFSKYGTVYKKMLASSIRIQEEIPCLITSSEAFLITPKQSYPCRIS